MDRLEIGEAGPEELDDVRAVLTAANETYRDVLAPAAFDAYLAMVLDLEARLAVAHVLLVRDRGRSVGTVTFFPDARDEGWGGPAGVSGIRSMGVHPDGQGRGVGAALVAECERRARRAGAHAIGLHTADWLPAAIRLYEHCGFVREPARDVRAVDVIGLPIEHDFVGLAYRLDL
jgi:GNAT superfamily N-acetyltransferase